ncbi:MAG: Gfo/Idh/MocA family protein [Anaerolineae bacterium]
MEEVRFAIVGTGGIGRAHGTAMLQAPQVRLVALCDVLEERMEAFQQELEAPVRTYTDYVELCKDPEVDAVFVGTPNQWHVPVALEAVKQGKHVLVTKRLADSKASARQLVEAAEAAGVVNMMSFTMRFSDPVQYLGDLRSDGVFGELYYARARSVRRSGIPDWSLGFIQKGGGAFRDMGVHVLDASWWLLGMPRPVSVTGVSGAKFGPRGQGYWDFRQPPAEYYTEYASDDYAGGFIRFEDGTGLQVESFWASHQEPELQIELFGTEAGAKLKPLTLYSTVNGAPHDTTIELPGEVSAMGRRIFGHFVDCVLNGVPCEAPLRHGLVVQEMMEALLESAETGQEVRFD